MTEPDARAEAEAGVSLIELVVYVLLTVVVLGTVAMILSNSWTAQGNVVSETEATNRGQLISSALERAVRNAVAIDVSGGSTLRVRTSLAGERECQGFALTGGAATMVSNSGPLGTSWPVWQQGIAAIPGEPLLEQDGTAVTYAFHVTTDAAPVRFQGTVSARNLTGVTSPCW
jgi:Tfp pilus assembly protein PilW